MEYLTAKQRLLIFGAFLLLVVLFLIILFGEKGFYDYIFLKNQYADIQKENMSIENEGRRIYQKIKRLKTDLDYIEEIARQHLGMIKENEVVYQFPSTDGDRIKETDPSVLDQEKNRNDRPVEVK